MSIAQVINFDPSDTFVNGPADIASWPVTVEITGVHMRPTGDPKEGFSFDFDHPLPDAWKFHSNPQVPSDNYQYTVWVGMYDTATPVAGQLIPATLGSFIEMWDTRPGTGLAGPFSSEWAKNWAYDGRWGALQGRVPTPGTRLLLFVSAGDARGRSGVTSVRERSTAVEIVLPGGDYNDWTVQYGADPVPAPTPTPAPTPQPAPGPIVQPVDLTPVLQAIAALEAKIDALPKPPAAYVGSIKYLGSITLTPQK